MNINNAKVVDGTLLLFYADPGLKKAIVRARDTSGKLLIEAERDVEDGPAGDHEGQKQFKIDLEKAAASVHASFRPNEIARVSVAPVNEDFTIGQVVEALVIRQPEPILDTADNRRLLWGIAAVLLVSIVIIFGAVKSGWFSPTADKTAKREQPAKTNDDGKLTLPPTPIAFVAPGSTNREDELIGANTQLPKDTHPPKELEPLVKSREAASPAITTNVIRHAHALGWPYTVDPDAVGNILEDRRVYDPTVSAADVPVVIPPGADYVYRYPVGWSVRVERDAKAVQSAYNVGTERNPHWILTRDYLGGNIQSIRLRNNSLEPQEVKFRLIRDRSIKLEEPRAIGPSAPVGEHIVKDPWLLREPSAKVDIFEPVPFDPNVGCYRLQTTLPIGGDIVFPYPPNGWVVSFEGNFEDIDSAFNVGTSGSPNWVLAQNVQPGHTGLKSIRLLNRRQNPATITFVVTKPGFQKP